MENRILICDDEEGMRRYLEKMLRSWGYQAEACASPRLLLRQLEESESAAELLLLDVKMPEMDGLEVLRRARSLRPELPVIMMTGHGTIDSAVEAMKIGAFDYLTKPFPQEKLFVLVRHCLERERLIEENSSLKREIRERTVPGPPIFRSAAFGEVYDLALTVAESDSNVLILGESGTGKELIAAAIHYASPRKNNRFLALNCAALTETLLESQLFGHVKGAFTGAVQAQKGLLEEAHEGTLFLDEIGDLSPVLQAKLLRVLQEGEFIPVGSTRTRQVDVRFLAATNKDLEAEVAAGRFREDLFYRLNVIALHLPPLRERPEDIEPLALHFLGNLARKLRRPLKGLAPDALAAMQAYRWPGNVRELENVIERCAILARGETIIAALLPFRRIDGPPGTPGTASAPPALNLREAERGQVLRALQETAWNKSRAAQLLGVTRKTLDRKIKDFHLAQADLPDRV
ncbi:MAG TPA: sigma-54 dependent transcriptional regulator [Desulfuromonadales bacterium]|nr:sigma-54 dependent transcriptional regulator [Desulfuromonadales bacterium]